MMSCLAVIPARLASTRLPRKVLADIHGKPLIWHVWNKVRQTAIFDDVKVVTDAEEVRAAAESWGANVIMSSPDCTSGTDRIASIVHELDADLIVNVQGDEPLVSPTMLDDLVRTWMKAPNDLITPVFRIDSFEELMSPTIAKVARTEQGEALYFSRSPIPFVRDLPQSEWLSHNDYWGHVGVYGYQRDVLAAYPTLQPTVLERMEQLEQLRFLAAGYRFGTFETDYRPIAVDVQADLDRVRGILASG